LVLVVLVLLQMVSLHHKLVELELIVYSDQSLLMVEAVVVQVSPQVLLEDLEEELVMVLGATYLHHQQCLMLTKDLGVVEHKIIQQLVLVAAVVPVLLVVMEHLVLVETVELDLELELFHPHLASTQEMDIFMPVEVVVEHMLMPMLVMEEEEEVEQDLLKDPTLALHLLKVV
tara:strand:+ start:345 stop:863 length:519 start_codon:yes stop_codon:yes gene_type:complete